MAEKQEEIFQIYLEEIRDLEMLTEEQSRKLLQAAGKDAYSRDRLIEGNLKTVLTCVGGYLNRGVPAEDLVQEANMALLDAVAEWAEEGSCLSETVSFTDSLKERVESALKLAVEEQDQEGKIRGSVLDRIEKLQAAAEELAGRFGREATLEELAERMGMTAEDIRDAMKDIMNAMESAPADSGEEEETDELMKEAFRVAAEEE